MKTHCTKRTAELIRETVLRSGKLSNDPDWPKAIVLPDDIFDYLLDAIEITQECLREKFDIPYIIVGSFSVRRESPLDEEPLASVWKELTTHA